MSEQNITIIIIGWGITAIIAIIGWIVAAVIAKKNRNLQKTIEQKKMRHDAYRAFMVDLDEMAKEMSYSPLDTMMSIMQKYLSAILNINFSETDYNEKVNESILAMTKELWSCVEHASKPLMKMSQNISALELDASDELLPMLQELKSLTLEFNHEWQNALGAFSKDQQGLQKLSEIGKDNKWQHFIDLQSRIKQQMRKEISIE